MLSDQHWEIGQAITLRGVWRQRIWWAGPARVAIDSADLVALYWPAGTRSKQAQGRLAMLAPSNLVLVDHVWKDTDVLMLSAPGESHSIWAMWETGTSKLTCWYVNLEEPLRRTSIGFDSMDFLLDIVIRLDRSAWHWKDEDEFETLTQAGIFTSAEARSIREEGLRAIHKLETNQSPFCDGWEHWRPPANWTIPVLTPGWENIDI
jgi:hypothetical protein